MNQCQTGRADPPGFYRCWARLVGQDRARHDGGVLPTCPARVSHDPFQPPRASDFALQGRANDTTALVLGAGIAGPLWRTELEKRATCAKGSQRVIVRGGRN